MKHVFSLRLIGFILIVGTVCSRANPTGGAVAAGSANIVGQGTNTVTVNQNSNTTIINWQTFSINAGELTKFVQPSSSSAALNRVLGGQTSFINGTLSANGQVYLLNGNGIVVGPGGVINTAGFTGSTRDISDSDFLSGNLHFVGSGDGGVKNLGKITALGGDVVLIGKTVDNQGAVNASGTAGLVAGDDVLLAQKNADGSTITVQPVSAPTVAGTRVGVRNSGTITASSAELKAANGNIYALAIQNEGLVRATTVTQQGGHIYLTSDSGTIVNSGTLDASATAAKGKGGTILVKSKAGKVVHSGKLIAKGGVGGTGGSAEVSGNQLEFTGSADLTALGGTTGNLLLDPATLNVITGGGNSTTASTVDPSVVDSLLNSTNLTLNADNNITISNAISWDSGNHLALTTNNTGSTIKINAAITDHDSNNNPEGGLIIQTAAATDVISTSSAGVIEVANFNLERGAWVQLIADGENNGNIPRVLVNGVPTNATLPAFTASNDFEIGNGTFLRADSGNGSTVYYGLEDVYGLQGMKGFLTSNFTLNGRFIDASGTSTWNSGSGFAPIGSESAPYQGSFDNGGINALTINLPNSTNVGIIGVAGANADISNIEVENLGITGGTNVGGLVGENFGLVDTCYNFGGGQITGSLIVGGLVGDNMTGATVQYGESFANVTGGEEVGGTVGENSGTVYSVQNYGVNLTGNEDVGGVVGFNTTTGTINLSGFFATVGPNSDESFNVGGIAGVNDGTIIASNSYVGASVTGDVNVGGIAGYNGGTIADSFNSASVTGRTDFAGDDGGGTNIGGIAGENGIQIAPPGSQTSNTDSFHTDFANGPGFTPTGSGVIQTSYNTGTVDGVQAVGGIVGYNDADGVITNVYNVGSVGDGDTSDSGGIVGDNFGSVSVTYNSGSVQGQEGTAGGLIGFDEDGATTSNSYWDLDTTGQSVATNSNIDNSNDEGTPAIETNLASVSSQGGTAYTIAGNDTGSGVGYGFFGSATTVPGTNGVYQIGTSPEGGPAWYIIDGQTRPMLGMEANSNINSPHQLQLIAVNLTGSYFITNSLDMSVTSNASDIWGPSGFVPIGVQPGEGALAFTGSIFGNGENISNLFINRPDTSDVGLIGYLGAGGYVEGMNLLNASVTGQDNVGTVVGTNAGGTITSVSLNNTSVNGENNVGGVVGNNSGTVSFAENTTGFANQPVFSIRGSGNNVGGIAGLNQSSGTVEESTNSEGVEGVGGSGIGGIVGTNQGIVTQTINSGEVGSGGETEVGGLVGDNFGRVDDSYSYQPEDDGSTFVSGIENVGGLVGHNESGATLETSYSTSPVNGSDNETTGAVVGTNDGTVRHVYWATDNAGEMPGIGANNNFEQTTDVVGYSMEQLTNINNYAQGSSPGLWDFSPQTGESGGIWGVNVYNSQGQINNGLPVLQWQTPVTTEVAVNSGDSKYGFAPTYTATGNGASSLATELPNGPELDLSDPEDLNAGTSHNVTISGVPIDSGYNIEFVNGSIVVIPAPLTVAATSSTIPSGATPPANTVTYTGFAPGHDQSDLNGELEFTVTPDNAADGLHTITPSGLSSSNYDITFVSGTLAIGNVQPPPPSQPISTVESELTSTQGRFSHDYFNGLDPLYFQSIPDQILLGGDLLGAINNESGPTDYIYISSTASLPALSRLVTPDTGIVTIVDGVVVVGRPGTGKPVFLYGPSSHGLPTEAVYGLRNVMTPEVYHELEKLIYGSH